MIQHNKYNTLKALASLLSCILCLSQAMAQVTIKPNHQTGPTHPAVGVLAPLPAYNASGATVIVNYVRTREAVAPFSTEAAFNAAGYEQVKQATQYLDGLGRPIQTVVKEASTITTNTTTPKDMVSSNVYDEFGREAVKYMPYISADNTGNFKLDPFAAQKAFNANQYNGEEVFYSQTQFEASPLNRPLKSMAPGNSWAGSDRGVAISYEINDANEVVMWSVNDPIENRPISTLAVGVGTAYYDAGQLYRTVTTDEHDKQVVEYKDKEGRVVLKKVQIDASPAITSHTGWLCTYYVYDDLGLLRCVIPPKATEYLANPASNWTFPAYAPDGILDELCFQYNYDARNRMITKKVPGAAVVHMVYDQRDRLVMTQDGNLKSQGKWMVTVYENGFNRPIQTYLYTNSNDQATHQAAASSSIAYPKGGDLASAELLTETYYDNYAWAAAVGMPQGFDENQYTNGSPYYLTPDNANAPYTQAYNANGNPLGQATGSKVRVLGTNEYLYTASFYDDKGRVIQNWSTLFGGGTSISTNQYDFSGKLLRSQTTQQRDNLPSMGIVSVMTYDHTGKLLTLQKDINNQGLKTIASNTYNELGQLTSKALGTDMTTAEPVETLDYTYNVRGWLTGINRGFANPLYTSEFTTQQNRWFGMELSYDYGFEKNGTAHAMFNGNIAGQIWKSKSNVVQRAYGYDYDAANRLMNADFNENLATPTAPSWGKARFDFTVRMGDGITPKSAYDANGNINAMTQMYEVGRPLDRLTYDYLANSNKLKSVFDAANDPTTKLGDFRTSKYSPNAGAADAVSKTDYDYDVNGNMIVDMNKDLGTATIANGGTAAIIYNHLNLPQSIAVKGKGNIEYVYDATGNKLRKIVSDKTTNPAATTTTNYVNGLVYESKSTVGGGAETLQFISHEEGRFRPQTIIQPRGIPTPAEDLPPIWVADYYIKDHLGNVRMTLTEETQVTEHIRATLESPVLAEEGLYFNNLEPIEKLAEDAYFDKIADNEKIDKVRATTTQTVTGMGILVKVQAGDKIKAGVFAHYTNNEADNQTPDDTKTVAQQLLNGINTSFANQLGEKGLELIKHNSSSYLDGILGFLSGKYSETPNEDGVMAHLNWMMLDGERLDFVQECSGFLKVPQIAANEEKQLMQANEGEDIEIRKSGYIYIFVSNSCNKPIRFDDLFVTRTKSALLEETHYYPFGLSMSGISSKAAGTLQNNKKYNGIEFDEDLGLNIYEAFYRHLDPQTGRWWEIDPKIDAGYESITPYNSMFNDPIRYSDFLGDEAEDGDGWWSRLKATVSGAIVGAVVGTFDNNTGTNIRGVLANDIINKDFATGWNSGLNVADAVGVVVGASETVSGIGLTSASGLVTALTAGGSTPVTAPTAALGVAVTVHGALATVNSANNLISQNGRVHIEDNEGGISIPKENQIPREKLNSPKKPGNAPTFKKDGKSVEIHHENQNPNGPFREIHPDVHRKIPNPIKQSKIDRKKFAKDRRNYWKKEFPSP